MWPARGGASEPAVLPRTRDRIGPRRKSRLGFALWRRFVGARPVRPMHRTGLSALCAELGECRRK